MFFPLLAVTTLFSTVWHLDNGAIFGTEPEVTTTYYYTWFSLTNNGSSTATYSYAAHYGAVACSVAGSTLAGTSDTPPPWSTKFATLFTSTLDFNFAAGSISIPTHFKGSRAWQDDRTVSAEARYSIDPINPDNAHQRRTRDVSEAVGVPFDQLTPVEGGDGGDL